MRQDVLEHVLEQALERAGVKVLWNHAVSRLVPQPDWRRGDDRQVGQGIGRLRGGTHGVDGGEIQGRARAVRDWRRWPSVAGAPGTGVGFPRRGSGAALCRVRVRVGCRSRRRNAAHVRATARPTSCGRCRTDAADGAFSWWTTRRRPPAGPSNRIPVEIGGARYPRLDEDRLRTLIADRAPWFTGRIEQIHWRIMVRFERRLASAFGRERVWLAGDAGHLTGPAGMQSMNVGLREAKQLADILTGVLREGGSVEPLQDYNRQRVAEWRGLLGLDGGLVPQADTDPWIRQHASNCCPASRRPAQTSRPWPSS